MNNDKKARRRHQRICEVLQEQEHMQVLELCELFHVSPATIRNDLTVLKKAAAETYSRWCGKYWKNAAKYYFFCQRIAPYGSEG